MKSVITVILVTALTLAPAFGTSRFLRCLLGGTDPAAPFSKIDESKFQKHIVSALKEYKSNMAFRAYVRKHGGIAPGPLGLRLGNPSDMNKLSALHAAFTGEDFNILWRQDKEFRLFVSELIPGLDESAGINKVKKGIRRVKDLKNNLDDFYNSPLLINLAKENLGINLSKRLDHALEVTGDIVTAKYLRKLLFSEELPEELLKQDLFYLEYNFEKYMQQLRSFIKDEEKWQVIKNYLGKNKRLINDEIVKLTKHPQKLEAALAKAYSRKIHPSFFESEWWRNFGFVKRPAAGFSQYLHDIYNEPTRLIFAPRNPHAFDKLNSPMKQIMKVSNFIGHPMAETFNLRRQLANPVTIPLSITAFSYIHYKLVDEKIEQRAQLHLDNINELNELLDIKIRLLSGDINSEDAIELAAQRGEDLEALKPYFNGETTSSNLESTKYWSVFRELKQKGFFKKKTDYEALKVIYLQYLRDLFLQRKGIVKISKEDLLDEAIAKIKQRFSTSYPAKQLLVLTGLDTMIPAESLITYYEKVSNNTAKNLNAYNLPFAHNLADHQAKTNKGVDLLIVDGLEKYFEFSESEKFKVLLLLNKLYEEKNEDYKNKIKRELLAYLNNVGKLPEVLFPLLLQSPKALAAFPQPFSVELDGKNTKIHSLQELVYFSVATAKNKNKYDFTSKSATIETLSLMMTELAQDQRSYTTFKDQQQNLAGDKINLWYQNFIQKQEELSRYYEKDYFMETVDLVLKDQYLISPLTEREKTSRIDDLEKFYAKKDIELTGLWGPFKQNTNNLFKHVFDYNKVRKIYENYYTELTNLTPKEGVIPSVSIRKQANETREKYLSELQLFLRSRGYPKEKALILSGLNTLIPQSNTDDLIQIYNSKDSVLKNQMKSLIDHPHPILEANKLVHLSNFRRESIPSKHRDKSMALNPAGGERIHTPGLNNVPLDENVYLNLNRFFGLNVEDISKIKNHVVSFTLAPTSLKQDKIAQQLKKELLKHNQFPFAYLPVLLNSYREPSKLDTPIVFPQYQGKEDIILKTRADLVALAIAEPSFQEMLTDEQGRPISSDNLLFNFPEQRKEIFTVLEQQVREYSELRKKLKSFNKPISEAKAAEIAVEIDFLKDFANTEGIDQTQKTKFIVKRIQLEHLFYNLKKINKSKSTWHELKEQKRKMIDRLERQVFKQTAE